MPKCESCGSGISPAGEHFTHYEPTNQYSSEIHALCSRECMFDYLDGLNSEDADEEADDEEDT